MASQASGADERRLRLGLLAGIALALGFQLALIFVQEFNWDEFYFLALVHDRLRGELALALQTLHVHAFAWLAALPGTEIDRLLAARLVMLLLHAVSVAALYALARAWTNRLPALAATFAFAVLPAALQHGASFRADPIALALLMTALALLARAALRALVAVVIGLLCAVAFLVTVKSIFFAPAFAGVAVWRLGTAADRRAALLFAVTAVVSAAAFAGLLFWLHQSALAGASLAGSGAVLASSGSDTLLSSGLFPRRADLLAFALAAPVQAVLLLAAPVLLARSAPRSDPQRRLDALALAGCAAPLLALLVYRNAYPYFLPFITAPAFAAFAAVIAGQPPQRLALLAAAVAVTAALALPRLFDRDQGSQRQLVAAVHEVFPRPVRYIDRNSMIASFPKRGFFMSSWGIARYRRGPPLFEARLRREPIPLLLVNGPALEQAVGLRSGLPAHLSLYPADEAVLRETYLPHWGRMWVAGTQLRLDGGAAVVRIRVPGPYTLESAAPVLVGGRALRPGEAVRLSRGLHRVTGPPGLMLRLRWGERLRIPAEPPPPAPPFQGF
jgi:hypothetical protein